MKKMTLAAATLCIAVVSACAYFMPGTHAAPTVERAGQPSWDSLERYRDPGYVPPKSPGDIVGICYREYRMGIRADDPSLLMTWARTCADVELPPTAGPAPAPAAVALAAPDARKIEAQAKVLFGLDCDELNSRARVGDPQAREGLAELAKVGLCQR